MAKIIVNRFSKFINYADKVYYRLECLFNKSDSLNILGGNYDEIICMENDIYSDELFKYIRDKYDNGNLTIHYLFTNPNNKDEGIKWTEIEEVLELDGKHYIISGIKSV